MTGDKIIKIVGTALAWVTVLAYVLIGFITNIWHPSWIILFLVPIIEEICQCIRTKDANRFPVALIVVAVYLTLGFVLNLWHPLWVMFLLIPLYYTSINIFKEKDTENDDDKDEDDEEAEDKKENKE